MIKSPNSLFKFHLLFYFFLWFLCSSWITDFLAGLGRAAFHYEVYSHLEPSKSTILKFKKFVNYGKKYFFTMQRSPEWLQYSGACILWCISLQPSFLNYTHHFSAIIDALLSKANFHRSPVGQKTYYSVNYICPIKPKNLIDSLQVLNFYGS